MNDNNTNLWAPWRIEYIKSNEKTEGCIFCFEDAMNDEKRLVVYRTIHSFVIMNLYPYNNGHIMVVPNKHISDLFELNKNEYMDLMELKRASIKIVKFVFNPHGLNVGMNLGICAGAGVDDHLHIHIVPRWNGDTNFMPVVGQTKVISEHMQQSFQELKKGFNDYFRS